MAEIALTQAPAHLRHGSNIGQPLTRREGVLKVTGAARYAADNHPPGMLHAVLAVSCIARGRVAFLDLPAAKAHPGVVEVMTPANTPKLAQDPDEKTNPFMFRLDVLQNDRVRHANQPIAVVIAETLEAATEGAALLSPRYETEPARIGLDAAESFIPPGVGVGNPAEMHRGDVEAGLAAASRRIEATYETPAQYHNANGTARDRGGMGRRPAVHRHAEPGSRPGSGAYRRAVRNPPGEHPHPQPLPGRRVRLQGPDLRAADPRHHGGATGRQARKAGAPAGADVRPGGPSTADAPDAAPRVGPRWRAHGHRPSHEDEFEHLRRFLRADLRCFAHALCESSHRHVA